MKKVAFITVHVGFNFGSALQAVATSNIIKGLGIQPECINYLPPRVTYKRYWEGCLKNPRKLISKLVRFPSFYINNQIFGNFLHRNCNMSPAMYANDDFSKKCPKADYYVTGSDQVWNFHYNEGTDTHYFFDGIKGVKVAFASSMGQTELSEDNITVLSRFLKDYKAISVREQHAVEMLSEIGIQSVNVLDPTFLIDKETWREYSEKRLIKDPYIFIYMPYNVVDKDASYAYIRRLAKERNLRVVTFSLNLFSDSYADETIRWCSPSKFLSLMINADYVFTNSFHGTAFSINLNKQFWVFMPGKFTSRIESVLGIFNLIGRTLPSTTPNKSFSFEGFDSIDYNQVNQVLEDKRKEAVDFLSNALDVQDEK